MAQNKVDVNPKLKSTVFLVLIYLVSLYVVAICGRNSRPIYLALKQPPKRCGRWSLLVVAIIATLQAERARHQIKLPPPKADSVLELVCHPASCS